MSKAKKASDVRGWVRRDSSRSASIHSDKKSASAYVKKNFGDVIKKLAQE